MVVFHRVLDMADTEDPVVGKQVGNYRVTCPLGAGAMGRVYLAEHLEIGRRMAIKFLVPGVETLPGMAERFLREARAVAAIQHPNVVEIFDFGQLDGQLYYIMELLEGRELRHIIDERGQMTPEEVWPYLEQICAALQAAHDSGVVHRDLKPGNVIVLDRAPLLLKLVDFGIAQALGPKAEPDPDPDGPAIMGTPLYIAPEAAAAQSDQICPRTDLYSLGVMLYRMLAGRFPFDADGVEELAAMHLAEEPPPLAEVAPELPAALAALVEQCLQKNPEERPESALAVAARFAAVLGAQPRHVTFTGAPAEPGKEPVPARERSTLRETVPLSASEERTASELPPRRDLAATAKEPAAKEMSVFAASANQTEDEALESLLEWLGRRGDFPAITRSVTEISSKTTVHSTSSARDVAEVILRDFGLTTKLLRLVNSAYYDRGVGAIKTVAHAVMMLGFDQVRMATLSLTLFQDLSNRRHATELMESAVRSLYSAEIGRLLAGEAGLRATEEAYICSLFRGVGRQMVMYCLPQQYAQIQELVEEKGLREDRAARLVLGVGMDRIDAGIARRWNLSDRLVDSLAPQPPGQIKRPRNEAETLRSVSSLANELCSVVQSAQPEAREQRLAELCGRYSRVFSLDGKRLTGLLGSASRSFENRFQELLGVKRSRFVKRVAQWRGQSAADSAGDGAVLGAQESGRRLSPPTKGDRVPAKSGTLGMGLAGRRGQPPAAPEKELSGVELSIPDARARVLDRALDEVNAALAHQAPVQEVLKLALHALHKWFGFSRAMLLVLRPDHRSLEVHGAMGDGVEQWLRKLEIPVSDSGGDVFSEALFKRRDIVVEDFLEPAVYPRIPKWYFSSFALPAFLVYPLDLQARAAGLLYAGASKRELLPGAAELTYVDRIRTHCLLALRRDQH